MSPIDIINSLDVNGDQIFNGLDLILLPLWLTFFYYFIKYVVVTVISTIKSYLIKLVK